ncbi:MAG: hypothetical protein ACTSQZ_06860 [Candidatus Thorarchaeota archaeon]
MSGTFVPSDQNGSIERDGIIQSFGSSIIEFEAVLYQKFLRLSGAHSLTSEKGFRKLLSEMHADGYIAPIEFQGKQCWKRLVIEDDLQEELSPEEVQRIFSEGSAKKKRSRPVLQERLVSDSSLIADEILTLIRKKLLRGRILDDQANRVVKDLVEGLRRALAESMMRFVEYVDEYVPMLRETLMQIARSKGEDILLLSLRKIEASHRLRKENAAY